MHLLPAYLTWNPNPEIIPGLPFRWYGLLFALSFLCGYFIIRRCFTIEKIPFHHMEKMALPMVLGTIGGARLGHCLFYEPAYYLENPLEILMVWKGGLASHGAAIGIITALILYARYAKWPVRWLFDRMAIPVALSGLFIRGGNFMNSEILGKETTLPWGVVFQQADQNPPDQMAQWKDGNVEVTFTPTHRTSGKFAIYRMSADSLYTLAGSSTQVNRTPEGRYLFTEASPSDSKITYHIAEDSPRFSTQVSAQDSTDTRKAITIFPASKDSTFLLTGTWADAGVKLNLATNEIWSGEEIQVRYSTDQVNWKTIARLSGNSTRQFNHQPEAGKTAYYRAFIGSDHHSEINLFARQPSMLYESLIYFFIAIFLFWMYNRRKGKVPYGEQTGWFMVLIFTVRILVEFTKIEQTDFQHSMPLNMGQMLSIPFVIFGIVLLILSRRAPSDSPREEVNAQPAKK